MAYALAWCGWRVEPVDWLLNPQHDLSKAECNKPLLSKCSHVMQPFGQWTALPSAERER